MFPNIGSQPKPDIGLPPAIAIIGATAGGALAFMIIYEAYLEWKKNQKCCHYTCDFGPWEYTAPKETMCLTNVVTYKGTCKLKGETKGPCFSSN
jgi:hypothetical protein